MNKKKPLLKIETVKQLSQSDVEGYVEKLYKNTIVGWAQYKNDVTKVVEVDVYNGDEYIETIQANQNTESNGVKTNLGYCGFSYALPEHYLSGENYVLTFINHTDKQPLTGSPFSLGNGKFNSEFHVEYGQYIVGVVQQRTASQAEYTIKLTLDKQVFWQQKIKGGNEEQIRVKLPAGVLDSKNHTVQIKLYDKHEKAVFMTMRKVKHSYRGMVEAVSFKKISGWVFNEKYPSVPVDIDIAINGKKISHQCNQQRIDVQKQKDLVSPNVGFNVVLPSSVELNTSTNLEIFIKGTDNRILNKKYILTPKDIVIRSLMSASEHLNSITPQQQSINLSAGMQAERDANVLVRQQIIAPIIKQLRSQQGLNAQLKLAINPICQLPAIDKSEVVDVIIPVYQGYDETIACIDSVLKAKNETTVQIIVINDQAPDGRLQFKLQAMGKEKLFTLIKNPKNLGFGGTANIGLKLHKDRDAVLLNSDTEVYNHWLDRMLNAANKNNNIATVTPFSNNATICSFPGFNQDNDLTDELSAKEIDQWFADINKNQLVDLPTAIGFCMLIKREVIETIGYLDETTWQKGYGEENDFCLKAAALGWRHVLAADVFVKHYGSVSFAEDKQKWLEPNIAKLNKLYPDYSATVQRFIKQDPIAKFRNPVIKKMLRQRADKYMLFIMHNLGGGAKTNADQMAALLTQQGVSVLELIAVSETQWELKDQTNTLCLKYQYPEDFSQLESDLLELGVWRIHFHQLIGFPKQIWQLPKLLTCEYDYTAHDFLPLCPRINMIDESGQYCNESQYDDEKCQRCIKMNGLPEVEGYESLWKEYDQSIKHWREDFKGRLSEADSIFCPSESTAKIYKDHYALSNICVKKHPESSFTILKPGTMSTTINIAIIGAIGEHKGSQLLLDCAKNALKEGLPLHFVLIGYSNIDEALEKLDNVTMTGAYKNSEQLQQLIQKNQCQLALFLSVWPETFCYTLTEALQNNLYPVGLDYGAIAERIKTLKFGWVLPKDLTANAINIKLMNVNKELSRVKNKIKYKGTVYKNMLNDYYCIDN